MPTRANAKQRKMTAVAWHGRLNEASTREDVVAAVQAFVAALAQAEQSQLPIDWARPVEGASQVTLLCDQSMP